MENRFKEFTLLLSQIGRVINKIKNEEMKRYGLKGTQVNCIYYIYGSKTEISAKDICLLCEEDKGAVSRTLKKLEIQGFIVCKKDENKKKYNSTLKLTKKGEEIGKIINSKINEYINYDESYISNQELNEFYKTFNKIYKNLKEMSEKMEDIND